MVLHLTVNKVSHLSPSKGFVCPKASVLFYPTKICTYFRDDRLSEILLVYYTVVVSCNAKQTIQNFKKVTGFGWMKVKLIDDVSAAETFFIKEDLGPYFNLINHEWKPFIFANILNIPKRKSKQKQACSSLSAYCIYYFLWTAFIEAH